MADLVTHLASALIPGALLGGPRAIWLAVGAVAPDVMTRVPGLALDLFRNAGAPIPPHIESPLGVFHMPVGIVLGAVAIMPLIHPEQRGAAARWIIAGGLLHLLVDVLQDHHGHGYILFYPFSTFSWELGWIGSEATTTWAPWLAVLTVLAWAARWGLRRRASVREGPPPAR